MKYDPEIHVPVRAAANASKGIRYTTDRHGNPRQLIAERGDGVRRFPVLDVYDPDATPKAAYHGPGAFRHVVKRSDLEEAERFATGHEAAEGASALADLARFAALKGARVWAETVPADEVADESWLVEVRGLSLPSDGCPGRYNTTAEKAAADILAEIWQEESVFHALV